MSLCIFLGITFFDQIVIHKPHELLALTISITLIYKYYSNSSFSRIHSKREMLFDGLLLGLAFGCQPLFAIVSFFSILFYCVRNQSVRLKIILLIVLPSSILAIAAIMPGILATVQARDNPPFNSNDYWLFTMLPTYFAFIIIVVLAFVIINPKAFKQQKSSDLFLPPILSLTAYIFLCVAASRGLIFPFPPQRFVILTAILILLTFFMTFETRLLQSPEQHSPQLLYIFFLMFSTFVFASTLIITGSPDDTFSTYKLSYARDHNQNLQTAAKFVATKGRITLLANGEFRFLQFYSPNNQIRMALPFNQGWISPNDDVVGDFSSLDAAAGSNRAIVLESWLEQHSVNSIMLEGSLGSVSSYPIDVLMYQVYPNYNFLLNHHLEIPAEEVRGLVKYGWQLENVSCNCTYLHK